VLRLFADQPPCPCFVRAIEETRLTSGCWWEFREGEGRREDERRTGGRTREGIEKREITLEKL